LTEAGPLANPGCYDGEDDMDAVKAKTEEGAVLCCKNLTISGRKMLILCLKRCGIGMEVHRESTLSIESPIHPVNVYIHI